MKTETRRSPFLKIAGGMLAVSLLTTCVISGTMAKYTSTASGSDTARAAKWSILVNDTEIATATPQTLNFDLFGTVGDANPETVDEINNDADVMDPEAGGTTIIAPGTGGYFELEITNKSEVTADISIELQETNDAGIPILYSFGDWDVYHTYADLQTLVESTYEGDWGKMLAALTDDSDMDALDQMEPNDTYTIPVYWTWAFEGEDVQYDLQEDSTFSQNDNSDTVIGINAQKAPQTVTITATVTATQVD